MKFESEVESAGLPPAQPVSWRKRLIYVAGMALAALLLWRLGRGLDGAVLMRSASLVPVWAWAAGVAGILASYALRAARMHAEWRPRTDATYGECLQLFVMHNAAVSLLPFRSGELGYAWWLLKRWQVPLSESLASLLWLRLQDALVLAWMALAGLGPWPVWQGVLGALVLAAAAVHWVPGWWQRWVEHGAARLPLDAAHSHAPASGVRGRVRRMTGKLIAAWRASRGGRVAWLYCVGNWSLKLLVAALLLRAVGPLDLTAAWRGALGGEWAAVLPVQGPAGLGTYEAGVWVGSQIGAAGEADASISSSAVIGAALLVHALWLATSVSAALIAWILSHRTGRRTPISQ